MKISVSSYSFQQYISRGKLTQYDTVEEAHKLGFENIEFVDMYYPNSNVSLDEQKEYAYKIRKRADELGMNINAYTIGADLFKKGEEAEAEVKRLCGQLEVAQILGASVLRHDVVYNLKKTGDGRSYALMLSTIAENTRKVADYGKKLGIKTCSENHGRIFQDSYRVEELFNAVNHDNYGVLVDFGNFGSVDENFATAVSRLAPYVIHAHCKDILVYSGMESNPGTGSHSTRGGNFIRATIIGQGNVPVKQCLRILKNAGYNDYVSIEFEGMEDCIVGISRGYENLKRYIEEIENE